MTVNNSLLELAADAQLKNLRGVTISQQVLAWYAQKRRKQRLIADYQEIDDSLYPPAGTVDEGGPI
jgi:uncharacterized protein VirK/YbjX